MIVLMTMTLVVAESTLQAVRVKEDLAGAAAPSSIAVGFGPVADVTQRACPSNQTQVAIIVRTTNVDDITVLARNKFSVRPTELDPNVFEGCRIGSFSSVLAFQGLHSIVTGCQPRNAPCWNITAAMTLNVTDDGCSVRADDLTYLCSSTVGVQDNMLTSRKNAGVAFNVTLPPQCSIDPNSTARGTNITFAPRALPCPTSSTPTDGVSTGYVGDLGALVQAGMSCEQIDEAFYCRRRASSTTTTKVATLKGCFSVISGCVAPNGGWTCQSPLGAVDYRRLCKITAYGPILLMRGSVLTSTNATISLPRYCYYPPGHIQG